MNQVFYLNQKAFSFFKKFINLPVFLCAVLCVSIFFGQAIDINIKRFFYTVSLNIKDVLVFFMPCIILAYMASSIIKLGQKASFFAIFVLVCLMCSNFLSTLIAYGVSVFTLKSDSHIAFNKFILSDSLKPLWSLYLPKIISNEKAILTGFILGIAGVYFKSSLVKKISFHLTEIVAFFLNRVFIPLVPLFVTGFILKLGHEGLLIQLSKAYSSVFLTIFAVQAAYILFLYGIAARFNLSQFSTYLKNVFPSALTAFCTMSSAATIPITLQGAEKNTGNVNLSRFLIPGTANIHLIGDSIGVPLMAIAIMLSFGFEFPSFAYYMAFALQFVLAKFCIAAVPGGGIIVMIPVIENYLGFSPEMASIISAFYIFFDPINTAMNVSGNGVFAILMSKINGLLSFKGGTNSEVNHYQSKPKLA